MLTPKFLQGYHQQHPHRAPRRPARQPHPTPPAHALALFSQVIDGKGHLLGRLASIIAKQILTGQKIVVVRCELVNGSGSFFRAKVRHPRRTGDCMGRVGRRGWTGGRCWDGGRAGGGRATAGEEKLDLAGRAKCCRSGRGERGGR